MKPTDQIEVITDTQGFHALRCEWDDLLERTGVVNPFVTYEWQWSWWETFGRNRRLFLVTIREEAGCLVALAPLMITRRFGARIVQFVGAGLSDYLGIVAAGRVEAVLGAVFKCLVAHRRWWDVLDLQVVDDWALVESLRATAAVHGWRAYARVHEIAPYVPVNGTWEDFVRGKSKKFRYALREREKDFEGNGRSVRQFEGPEVDGRLLDALWEVERHSWKVREGSSALRSRQGRSFYERFLPRLGGRGWVEARVAYNGDQPIAYVLTMPCDGRVLLHSVSYHEDFARIAPGMLLLQQSIRDAFERKVREYDFLRGDEAYKWRWAAAKREILQVLVTPSQPRALLTSAAYRLRWWLARSERLRAIKLRMVALGARLRYRAGAVR